MKTVKIPVIARNEVTRQSSFFKSISQFVTVFYIALVFSDALMAAERVPFSQRNPANTRNIYGEVTSVGNIVVCKKNASNQCVDDDKTNNESNMLYVNVDGGTGIFNASTAQLTIPAGATVKWAGLYWQGMISNEKNVAPNPDINARLCTVFDTNHKCTTYAKPTTADLGSNRYESDKVLLKKDAGTYSKISATQFDYKYETDPGKRSYYNAFAEVTSLVQSGGNYTIANLQSQEGQYDRVEIGGNYGGWALFVIYEKDGLPFKNISVFDGYKGIINTGDNPYDVDISGFQAPCGTVPVNAQSIVFAGEGDISYGGDSLTFTETNLTGTPINVSANVTGINLSDNIFDSSINGTFSRSPNITNTKGNDLDTFDIGATGRDIFTNGQMATRASFSSGLDRYFPSVFAFSIDTYSPAFDVVQKSVTNTTADHSVTQPYVNDILKYAIHFENNGNAEASNARFEDTMPLAADYDGSLICTKTASNGTQTSCASTCTLPSAANGYKLVCPLATVEAGADYDISFNVKVRNTLRSDGVTTTKNTPISNQGYVYFKNGAACGVSVPEEHVSTNIAETGNINVITLPPYQNEYGCGMFGSVLTSYDLISSGADHPANNDQACYTGSISYPETKMIGEITCNPTGCGGSAVCERVDPPANKLEYTVNVSSKLGISEGTPVGTLSGAEYGDFSGNFNMTLSPSTTYGPMNTPVMVLGDVTLTSSNTLTLAPGDYFFNSITFTKNNPSIVLSGGGPVRIFINNNLTIEQNGLNINAAGIPDNLFVYIRGNLEALTNGAVEVWKGFFYVEGSARIDANSNQMALYGGITAEGPIVIEGNNGNFYQQGDSSNLGYGDCQLCYGARNESGFGFGGFQLLPKLVIPIHNISPVTLENVEVFETYNSSATFSVFSTKKVVNENGDTIGTADTINTADFGFSNIVNMSLKNNGIQYHIGDNYTPNGYPSASYRAAYSSSLFSMNMDFFSWNDSVHYFASFTDNLGRDYNNMVLGICEASTPSVNGYLTGPFDAWDTFRSVSDSNISTKIASKNFNLTIGSLNSSKTALEAKTSGIGAYYQLYDINNSRLIGNQAYFDANASSSITWSNINVPNALQNTKVRFKYCADYNGTEYTLRQNAQCSAECTLPTQVTNNAPCFRYVYSSDAFAIRPEKLEMVSTDDDWANLLRSGEEYNMSVNAYNYQNTTNTLDYNVTSANTVFNVNTTKYMKNDDINGSMAGTLTFGGSDFNMSNGLSVKTGFGGSEVAGISFSDVGKINIRLEDRVWSAVDNDDTPMNCDANGTYVCGDANVTFIPHHFNFSALGITNNNGNTDSFTYLANEVALMSGRINAQMQARNKAGAITSNFSASPLWENPVTVVPVVTKSTYLYPDANETNISNQSVGFSFGAKTIAWDEDNASQYLRFNFRRDINLMQNPFDVNGSNLNISMTSRYTDGGKIADINGSRLNSGTNALPYTVVSPADGNSTFVYGRIIPRDVRVFGTVPFSANAWYEVFNAPRIGTTSLAPSRNESSWFVNGLHDDAADGDGMVTFVNSGAANIGGTAVGGVETYGFGAQTPPYSAKAHINTDPWLWYGVSVLPYSDPSAANLECTTHPCFNINVVPEVGATGSAKSGAEENKASKSSSKEGTGWHSTTDYAPAIR